jgi:DNA-directed RNA polymerase specialized sigma54-like protein
LVIHAFQDGATPETIIQRYPTVTLADAYATVTYYLRHRDEVEAYLADREREADAVRQRIESRQGDLADVRRQLLARQHA